MELSLSHPSLINLHPSIGKTYYERDIFAVHVTDKASVRAGEQRPKVYIQCLLHPSECMGVCSAAWLQTVTYGPYSLILKGCRRVGHYHCTI